MTNLKKLSQKIKFLVTNIKKKLTFYDDSDEVQRFILEHYFMDGHDSGQMNKKRHMV